MVIVRTDPWRLEVGPVKEYGDWKLLLQGYITDGGRFRKID